MSKGSVHWDEKAKRKVIPRRRHPSKLSLRPRKLRAILLAKLDQDAEAWESGLEVADAALAGVTRSVIENLKTGVSPALPAESGALVSMLRVNAAAFKPKIFPVLIDYWIATAGSAYAVEALVESWNFEVASRPGSIWLERAMHSRPLEYGDIAPWKALRRRLCQVSEESYQNALKTAKRLRAGDRCPLAVRCALSFLFPGVNRWSVEDYQACCQAGMPQCTLYLAAALADAQLLDDLTQLMGDSFPPHYAFTLVDALGSQALQSLRNVLEAYTANKLFHEPRHRETVARALLLIESPEAARVFRDLSENDVAIARAGAEHQQRFPQLYSEL